MALTVSASIPSSSSSSSSSSPASPPHPLSASHIHPYHGCPLPPDVATPAATATSGQAPGPCSGLSVDIHGWSQHPTVESLFILRRALHVLSSRQGRGQRQGQGQSYGYRLGPERAAQSTGGYTRTFSPSCLSHLPLSPCTRDRVYRLGTGCSARPLVLRATKADADLTAGTRGLRARTSVYDVRSRL